MMPIPIENILIRAFWVAIGANFTRVSVVVAIAAAVISTSAKTFIRMW